MPGLGSIRLAPTAAAPYKLACFFPESKGKPASVRVVQHPQLGVPLAAKSFYKCVVVFKILFGVAAIYVARESRALITSNLRTP